MITFTQKNSQRKPLEKLLPLSMPLGLCIEPTNLCNFKCIQCPVSLPDFKRIVNSRGNMDMGLYRKILNDVKAMGRLNNLNLYGDGEPLLNPRIGDMVRMAREIDVSENITITTNASLLEGELTDDLLRSALTYLRVSIYSNYEKSFKYITKAKTNPEKIKKNLVDFRKKRSSLGLKKPFIYIKMLDTFGPENQKFLDTYSSIGDQVNIETPMNWNGFDGHDLISTIDPDGKTVQTNIQGFYEERGKSGIKKICTTAFHSLNIKQNGDVTICIVDWNKGTKVGNIGTESLADIWFGETLREFRKMHIQGERGRNPSCRNCKYLFCNPDNIDSLTNEQFETILNYCG